MFQVITITLIASLSLGFAISKDSGVGTSRLAGPVLHLSSLSPMDIRLLDSASLVSALNSACSLDNTFPSGLVAVPEFAES